ncbi:aftiphilin a isoform X2 [Leuresthes tenuis]|uniref:aftiphilin a isoform X2 n=1 Tax=Leuresthes tenuis TaxID=355514 RepID=UPI003B5153E9
MEPDVIRLYSSSPPPLEDGAEEEDDEFGDFGTFSGVPNSISFSEFDTPTTFNQSQALTATSPPELLNRGGVGLGNELSKANGVAPLSLSSERTEMKKLVSRSLSGEPADCNGAEVLTNGFVTLDIQGRPPSPNSVHSQLKGTSPGDPSGAPGDPSGAPEDPSGAPGDPSGAPGDPSGAPGDPSGAPGDPSGAPEDPSGAPGDDFADFAAFSNEGRLSQAAQEDTDDPACCDRRCNTEQESASEDGSTNRTEAESSGSESPRAPAEAGGSRGPRTDSPQRDGAPSPRPSEAVCTHSPSGTDGSKEAAGGSELSPDAAADSEAAPSDEKGSETETETSFGRPLSADALEEYGDASTTGSVPSPPLQGDTASAGEGDTASAGEDDEDFGDFGGAASFGAHGFADFDQLDVPRAQSPPQTSSSAQEAANTEQDDDFGDFNSPKLQSGGEGGTFASFPVSDSFGNFSSAGGGEADGGWSAFGEQQEGEESWAAFSTEPSGAPPAESRQEEEEEGEAAAVSEESSRTDKQPVLLSGRLEKLFQSSFPPSAAQNQLLQDRVLSLQILLDPAEPGAEEERSACSRSGRGGVWMQLQDIHEALGLRYQWGGSYCNKALLCCLGIDTRNILFTGQKKQPVIVPMYAAGLGMLEPTKEPVKPVSAAEMITSIAQVPPAAPEKSSCSSDSVQEALPPVQFDWSSSGLTNPLDGVDPELFELTTVKLDPAASGGRVADAFARLMSTMEKTSTSTRKPKKDENLSEEAAKVIAALPDLSFMQAKVLMFPATLTPLSSQATPD